MSNLKKIESFTVNHKLLVPGIYISRVDYVNGSPVTTFDIRVKRPNFEDCMQPAEAHTIEHLGATYFRSSEEWSDKVIYFGPMGCLTGFYLILAGEYQVDTEIHNEAIKFIMGMFQFVCDYKDRIPGTTPIECGNYRLHNLENARTLAANMLVLHETFSSLMFEYPTEDNHGGIKDSCAINLEVLHNSVLPVIDEEYYENCCDKIDYEDIVEVDKSLDCLPEDDFERMTREAEEEMYNDYIHSNPDLFPEAFAELFPDEWNAKYKVAYEAELAELEKEQSSNVSVDEAKVMKMIDEAENNFWNEFVQENSEVYPDESAKIENLTFSDSLEDDTQYISEDDLSMMNQKAKLPTVSEMIASDIEKETGKKVLDVSVEQTLSDDGVLDVTYNVALESSIDKVEVNYVVQDSSIDSSLGTISRTEAIKKMKDMTIESDALF